MKFLKSKTDSRLPISLYNCLFILMQVNIFFSCRFMVRDFTYNEKDIADGKLEITKLEDDKKKLYVSIC